MTGEKIIEEAQKYLGVKYVKGGASPNGFDDIGLINYVYKKIYGKILSQDFRALIKMGKNVNSKELIKGDLIFCKKHVGIFIGNGQFIIVDPKHGVRISAIVDFNTARRIL